MPPSFERVKAVFLAALDRPPADRAAVLDELCGADAPLRAAAEAMLRAHDEADPFLDRPVTEFRPPEARDTVIAGRYRLVEVIGEGGMGSVWRAEQTEPVRRSVALKVIKAGMDSKEVLARFEAERQALALMDHAHIAKVLDGGTTPAGRPFFVMEYVPGVPLTDFCDAERLDVAGRLALFVQVCQAVQHAHQKGVIHRDLKPSNVLVTRTDAGPVPKVIDFGLAKATRQPLTAATLQTGPGMLMGTLQYMAPEQAELDNPDIDTRADVYALGVILYELLTGTTPLDKQRLKQAAWLELLRLIQQEEPPRPSTRLSGSGSLPSVAAQRSLEPVRLTRLVRGDLDWIVMKALEKDRVRRYDSAGGFAADVQRYLIGDPVVAHPPSAAYRLRKFVRRNRPQVVAVALVLLALVAGVVGTTAGLIEARKQERQARTEADAKEAARQAEAEQRALAEGRLAKLENGVKILGAVFANIDPTAEKRGGDPIAVAIGKELERAADELQGEAVGDPLVVARLQSTLGASLFSVGRYAKAIEVLERAIATRAAHLGDDRVETHVLRAAVANAYMRTGEVGRAIALFEASVPALVRELGATAPEVLRVRGQYAHALVEARRGTDATALLAAVVADYQAAGRGTDHLALIATNMLAHAHLTAGDFKAAVPILERLVPVCVVRLGVDHPDTLIVRNNLAMGYNQAGQFKQALDLQRGTYEALLAKFGDDHPNTLGARYNLALATRDAGKYADAAAILERLLPVREAKDGPAHRSTLNVCRQLGQTYVRLGDSVRAIPLFERVLKAWLAVGPDGPDVEAARNALGLAYLTSGQPARAVPLFEADLAAAEKAPGRGAGDLITTRSNLADALSRTGQLARAATMHEANLAAAEGRLGADHPTTLMCRNHVAGAYLNLGRRPDALPLLERNVALGTGRLGEDHPVNIIYRLNLWTARRNAGDRAAARGPLEALVGVARREVGPTHPTTLGAVQAWADVLEDEKAWDRAVAERQQVVDIERKRGPAGRTLAASLVRLGQTLVAAGRFEAAEPPLKEALAIRERLDPDLWGTFNAKSILGAALAGQKKYDAAEPPLLDGYRGLKARADLIPHLPQPPLPQALDRLVNLYEAWSKPAEAAKWRAEGAKGK